MMRREMEIVNKLGLHARAAARLVRLTNQFVCDVYIAKDGEEVNAKSILGILSLAAAQGSLIFITCDGEDEKTAINMIKELVKNKFEEAE